MNLYDVVVRRPRKQTEKYAFRAYSEVIQAPMVRVILYQTNNPLSSEQLTITSAYSSQS